MNLDRFVQARRAAAALGALVGTLALCTACVGASTPGTTSTGTGTVVAKTSSTGTGTGGATGGGATTTSGTGSTTGSGGGTGGTTGGTGGTGGSTSNAGSNTCLVRYLNGTVGASQGTAGSVYVNIVFKNLNNAPCTLYGYPGVSFGKGGPGTGVTLTQVGAPADKNPAVAKTLVTLQPGGYAYATLQIGDAGNYPSATCNPTPTTYLMVYPPNTSNQLYIPYTSTACTSSSVVTLHVEAVQAGTGG
ncbi:DUF4232 domain-containing protein [Actinospica durhamensis]|uniref:DUF4232 domain-containing protein n=1 Tax=Actinospica durhamensis TaxID=1508375 RepID=A0A941EY44_9ACTN|nr:DUF4232 domain-containing protein [Actinospica durhamensis]MBR7839513.1 DUF4232 domain-containing protein [Actinospica durhamensis]